MKIDIYDFDKTIVPFDSGSLFCVYCLCRYPYLLLFLPVAVPVLLTAFLLVAIKAISFTDFKKICFLFVTIIPLERAVNAFWNKYDKRVHKWFYDRQRFTVVISASPDFLLEEIQRRLGFEVLICTHHSRKTGIIIGENCRGEEKVRRLYALYPKEELEVVDVYSDSLRHDKAIFSLGENCYNIVKGERIAFSFDEVYK